MLHQRIFVKSWKNPANSVYSLANCEWSRNLYSRRFIRYMNWHLKSIHQSDSRILQQLQSSFSCWTQPFLTKKNANQSGKTPDFDSMVFRDDESVSLDSQLYQFVPRVTLRVSRVTSRDWPIREFYFESANRRRGHPK